jgi:hypothetical protein
MLLHSDGKKERKRLIAGNKYPGWNAMSKMNAFLLKLKLSEAILPIRKTTTRVYTKQSFWH